MTEGTAIGVWWDISWCAVPDGFDPLRVRQCIESELEKHFGHEVEITIFCYGNLKLVSPQLLNAISSSGILLTHSGRNGGAVLRLMQEWKKHHPPPAVIMLISNQSAWFAPSFHPMGYTLVLAVQYPSPFSQQWDWNNLLKENLSSEPLVETNSQIINGEHAWFCAICQTPSQSFDDFTNHLEVKRREHMDMRHKEFLWLWSKGEQTEMEFEEKLNRAEEDLKRIEDEEEVVSISTRHQTKRSREECLALLMFPNLRKQRLQRIEHKQEVSTRSFGDHYKLYPMTTSVWWDIDTCPVPQGHDPGRVRQSIKSPLQFCGPRSVIMFCVGNLELVSPQVLKEISASGIFLRHIPDGAIYPLLCEWKERFVPPPCRMMLISGNNAWFDSTIRSLGYTIFRAFPDPHPLPFKTYPPIEDWNLHDMKEGVLWESLLQENADSEVANDYGITNTQLLKDQPDWFCTPCKYPSKTCDDFFNHLNSAQHKDHKQDA